jgi:hypothetical protein
VRVDLNAGRRRSARGLGPAGSELLTAAAELGLPTDAVLFDVENDPPALLQPGMAVRFVSVA